MKNLTKFTSLLIIMILSFSLIGTFYVTSSPVNDSRKIENQSTAGQTSLERDQQNKNKSGLVKMLNYNVEYSGADPNWTEVIKRENPDIFLFVETGKFVPSDGSFDDLIDRLNSFFPNEKPYEGVTFEAVSVTDGQAVISRYPIVDTTIVDSLKLDDGSTVGINHNIVDATLNIHGTEVHILVNHLTCCGGGFPARMEEQEGIMNYIDTLGDVPIIYGGDFNSESPQDTGEIAPLQETLGTEPIELMINSSHPLAPKHVNFTDTYRYLNPNRKGYTLNNVGRYQSIDHYRGRIDYIFTTDHLIPNYVNSSVVDDYYAATHSSDHKPMYTYFNFLNDTDLQPPLPVSNPSVEVNSDSTSVSWSSNDDDQQVHGYRVYRNNCLVAEVPKGTTSVDDNYHYDTNTHYKYSVSAFDINYNEGRPSLDKYVDTSSGELTVPSKPKLSASSVSEGIFLRWSVDDNGGLPIERYKIYRTLDTEEFQISARTSKTNHTAKISKSGVTVYFKVLALNAIGESKLSDYASAQAGSSSNLIGDLSTKIDWSSASKTHSEGLETHNGDNCPPAPESIPPPSFGNNQSNTQNIQNTQTTNNQLSTPIIGMITSSLILVIFSLRTRSKNEELP